MSATFDAELAEQTAVEWRERVEFSPGVKFTDEPRFWWTVRCTQGRYTICTRVWGKDILYTIVDWQEGVRGAVNEVGGGWGDGKFSKPDCWSLLAALHDPSDFHEVSHRNRVTLRVCEVSGG